MPPPFTFHKKEGNDPPLVGVAVKITEKPEQTGFSEDAIVTETGEGGYTVMVITLEVSGLFDEQVALEVKMQMIWSPFTGE